MIEKLKETQVESQRYKIVRKINEIIDALNPILEERESQIKVYEESKNMFDNAILDGIKDKKIDITILPKDPYAKQRKWIGKLCRFRDEHYDIDCWEYGILTDIENVDVAIDSAFRSSDGQWYDICEPITVADDIIYKE